MRIPLLLCLVALLAGGCGSSSDTGVTLTVSRDFGEKSIQPQKSATADKGTVLDLLQSSKYTVRAGGGEPLWQPGAHR